MPDYDRNIKTVTETRPVNTMHTDWIDWDGYDFHAKEQTDCMCCDDGGKAKRLQRQIDYLKQCEGWKERKTWASDYGGWPRIWQEVLGVGMASAWPYWRPRPVVLVSGTFGVEWFDWTSLTGVKVEGE